LGIREKQEKIGENRNKEKNWWLYEQEQLEQKQLPSSFKPMFLLAMVKLNGETDMPATKMLTYGGRPTV